MAAAKIVVRTHTRDVLRLFAWNKHDLMTTNALTCCKYFLGGAGSIFQGSFSGYATWILNRFDDWRHMDSTDVSKRVIFSCELGRVYYGGPFCRPHDIHGFSDRGWRKIFFLVNVPPKTHFSSSIWKSMNIEHDVNPDLLGWGTCLLGFNPDFLKIIIAIRHNIQTCDSSYLYSSKKPTLAFLWMRRRGGGGNILVICFRSLRI